MRELATIKHPRSYTVVKPKEGDTVDLYIPVGEEPYEHEIRTVTKVHADDDTVTLDDCSNVGTFYCTVITPSRTVLAGWNGTQQGVEALKVSIERSKKK